jgi:hypothetical protein
MPMWILPEVFDDVFEAVSDVFFETVSDFFLGVLLTG